MKLKLRYALFCFNDENKNSLDVICEDAKKGDNIFKVYKNGVFLGSHQPQGGHVNKTTAKIFLLKILNNTNNENR